MSVNATFAVVARTRNVSRRPCTCPTTGNILILHKPLWTTHLNVHYICLYEFANSWDNPLVFVYDNETPGVAVQDHTRLRRSRSDTIVKDTSLLDGIASIA